MPRRRSEEEEKKRLRLGGNEDGVVRGVQAGVVGCDDEEQEDDKGAGRCGWGAIFKGPVVGLDMLLVVEEARPDGLLSLGIRRIAGQLVCGWVGIAGEEQRLRTKTPHFF